MASLYRLQIVDDRGDVVYHAVPGLAAEVELVENIVSRVGAKGVGVGRSTAHVLDDVRAAIRELFFDLKSTVPPPHEVPHGTP